MQPGKKAIKGRGAAENPAHRFTTISLERDPDWNEDDPAPQTQILRDEARSILVRNSSPDVPFEYGINPYRGCEHGCIYCYARPSHEYFGLSAGVDFESKILVKEHAPQMLARELSRPGWKPQVIALSGNTDAYQPLERRLKITRGCLEVLRDFRNPVAIITKNALITRDLDLLRDLNKYDAVAVMISVTTLDGSLTRILEPRTSQPAKRLQAIRSLAEAGIPVGVMVAPVIPGITDHETAAILEAAAAHGATRAGYVNLRLPLSVAPLLEAWLEEHYPDRKNKVLNRVRSMHAGKLNVNNFGARMRGKGAYADLYSQQFKILCERFGLNKQTDKTLSNAHFRRFDPTQNELWQ